MKRELRSIGAVALAVVQLVLGTPYAAAAVSSGDAAGAENSAGQTERPALGRYFDPAAGMSVDEAVSRALEGNGELRALRAEVGAARSLVRQAGYRPNPRLDVGTARQVGGTDNGLMIGGMLPLELGGRRSARIAVAERELEVREAALADRERVLAAEVRAKFGEALAQILKLGVTEELLTTSRRGYRLVVARVSEGRTAPLEQNIVLVEVNRLRSLRESDEGRVEVVLLELRNLIGAEPTELLRLRGDFSSLVEARGTLAEDTAHALESRPDLQVARAAEALAEARIETARAMGRPDAELRAGYQRMQSGYMLNGTDAAGRVRPIEGTFHSVTAGITVELPVRNKNLGAIEAAVAELEAAKQRREFLELTVRREVAAARARYERATRALEIYRVGVRGQANRNLEVIRQTYELGAKTLLDYIGEQRRYIELETSYIDAILNAYLARVEIERVSAAPELTTR